MQTFDCPSASEVTLKYMGKIGPNHNKKQSKMNNAYNKKRQRKWTDGWVLEYR